MSNSNTEIEKMQEENLPNNIEWKYQRIRKYRNVYKVTKMSVKPYPHIKKVGKDSYLIGIYNNLGDFFSNGEVFKMQITPEGMRNRRSLRKIFNDLWGLIYINFHNESNNLFLTLTYANQTNDPKKIYLDFNMFMKRLKRRWKCEYIAIVEPHESGNFHIHLLLCATESPSDWAKTVEEIGVDMYYLWGHGYVTVERLNGVDNIGSYFIAYFTNMELSDEEAQAYGDDVVEKNGKKYIKGKRLDYYPDYMKIYRTSKGIIKPTAVDDIPMGSVRTYSGTIRIKREDSEVYLQQEQYQKDEDSSDQ